MTRYLRPAANRTLKEAVHILERADSKLLLSSDEFVPSAVNLVVAAVLAHYYSMSLYLTETGRWVFHPGSMIAGVLTTRRAWREADAQYKTKHPMHGYMTNNDYWEEIYPQKHISLDDMLLDGTVEYDQEESASLADELERIAKKLRKRK